MKRALLALAALAPLAACHQQGNAVLLIVVTASGSPPTVSALDVTISGPAQKSTKHYTHDDGTPIAFPTTLSAELPGYATGTLEIDVHADDAAGAEVAAGHEDQVAIRPGEHKTIYVQLGCAGDPCVVDGGVGNNDSGPPTNVPFCGNGVIDMGESCDTAIAPGNPGACPQSCDDHVACTTDSLTGSGCNAACGHKEILTIGGPRDGCCPKGATSDPNSAMHDDDCPSTCGNGTVDPFETCDTAIPAGNPGACPTDSDCTSMPCMNAQLISAGTCSAVCMRYPIVSPIAGDNCCPPGATHIIDGDCPIVCGNGLLEPGETCDVGIAPLRTGACPTSCLTTNACNPSTLVGSGCQATCSAPIPIDAPISGDGCCQKDQAGNNLYDQTLDTDCGPVCGNGVVERGEWCDGDSCPTSCPPTPSACLQAVLVGSKANCTAHCEVIEVTACSPQKDGCCPTHCTFADDPDCSDLCGDGFVQTTHREVCDIAITTPRSFDACPDSCAAKTCMDDRLVSAGTCEAACMYMPVTSFRPGDGCCAVAAGANFLLDPDCSPVCGNGVVESPAESCDFAIPGSCPNQDSCPPPLACTRYVVKGTASACSATCVATQITACADGDQCCPAGCWSGNDSDCAVVCGNGIVETGETCDRGITTGVAGSCPRSCDDGDACTADFASGSSEACTRLCSHQAITACIDGDGCCPAGCSAATDKDCAPRCGDGQVGAFETCDPPSSCPTSCPDDGDPCTAERLVGDAAACNAACVHFPITACLAAAGDGCCPTGCTRANDWDCL